MGPGDLLVALLGGAAIGVLGKWLALRVTHGTDDVPLWLTILCGVAGIVVGTFLHGMFFQPLALGVDGWRLVWQVTVGAALVGAAAAYAGWRHHT